MFGSKELFLLQTMYEHILLLGAVFIYHLLITRNPLVESFVRGYLKNMS